MKPAIKPTKLRIPPAGESGARMNTGDKIKATTMSDRTKPAMLSRNQHQVRFQMPARGIPVAVRPGGAGEAGAIVGGPGAVVSGCMLPRVSRAMFATGGASDERESLGLFSQGGTPVLGGVGAGLVGWANPASLS